MKKQKITMRKLLASGMTDKQVLNRLLGLHVGVTVAPFHSSRILGSMWTVGCKKPTLEWVKWVRTHVKDIEDLTLPGWPCWLDGPLYQESNWHSPAMDSLFVEMTRQGAL